MTDDFRPVKKIRKVRESDVEAAFVARVKSFGLHPLKYKTIARRAAPDRIIIGDNRHVEFCELKRSGEKPTPEQAREHGKLRSMSFRVSVIDNVNDANAWTPDPRFNKE